MLIFLAGDVFEKGQDVDENFLKQAHFVRINGFKSLKRHVHSKHLKIEHIFTFSSEDNIWRK